MNPLLLPELIALVADYFDSDEATHPSLVCRVWNAAFGPIVWRSYLIDTKTHNNDHAVPGIARNALNIRQLTCKEVSSIGQFLIPCMKLTDIVIWQDYRGELTEADPAEYWDRFSLLIRQNLRLNKVSISVSGSSATDDFWAAVSSIARVEISNIKMSEQDIHTFWSGCKTIQELSIESIQPIDNIDFFTGAQENVVYSDMRRIAVLDRMRDIHIPMTGDMIQKVLESCPMLIEFLATEIHAPQIQQGRPWVCLGLKRLSMCVVVDSRTAKNVRRQSQVVFEQIGKLTRLEMLTVGVDKHDVGRVPKFQGLDFRLESGMDLMVGLTRLEKLSFMRTKQNMSYQDVAWMRRHLWRLVMVRGRCNMYGEYREQPV
ncbi:hypothetical protein BG000_010549 [Podila horticola]|nr:hypothetical protein BG000_010549 [Podila horticola]